MSQQAVEQVIGRAVTDTKFRQLLYSDPDQALAGYDLTKDEREAILATESQYVEEFARKLDIRIQKTKILI